MTTREDPGPLIGVLFLLATCFRFVSIRTWFRGEPIEIMTSVRWGTCTFWLSASGGHLQIPDFCICHHGVWC